MRGEEIRESIEPVYRPAADPSVPERELDRLVPEAHPAWKRALALLDKLGGKPLLEPTTAGPPVGGPTTTPRPPRP